MLFQAYGQVPIPLEGQELAERLEALRRRNRGAEQRRREQANEAHRRVTQPSGSQFQPPTEFPSSHRQ
jgi:DNA-binding response OmpR family regulator